MLFINVDISALDDLLGLDQVAHSELEAAAREMAAATRGKIVELAKERLHTRRGKYLDALTLFQLDETTFVVNLDASARWIEDGMDEHEMLDDLLKSKKAKRAKDGSTYLVVPFQLNKPKQQLTPAQQSLLSTVKKALAQVGQTPNRLETDATGKPKLGLVRSLDITKAPISTQALRIGGGPKNQVAQGTTGGIPLLKGVRVYQKEMQDKDGGSKVGRFVMTFRVASSKQKGGGKWQHPGVPAVNLMDEGLKWALEQWESKVAPSVLAKIVAKIS